MMMYGSMHCMWCNYACVYNHKEIAKIPTTMSSWRHDRLSVLFVEKEQQPTLAMKDVPYSQAPLTMDLNIYIKYIHTYMLHKGNYTVNWKYHMYMEKTFMLFANGVTIAKVVYQLPYECSNTLNHVSTILQNISAGI